MTPYCYSPLKSELGSIRLLRILPSEDETADIQCELFEYPLHISRSTHPYEALSYVWGDPDKTYPILVQGTRFDVTVNLYAALLQLRNHSIERVLWVDAICIDQGNQAEKERQIQYMANIYGQANRVLVWLGEASNDSDLAFNEMRRVKGKEDMTTLEIQRLELAGLALLQRPWFQRIWILQEIAAAQNVLIMCGHKKIEGYAFCTGIESLNISYRTRQDLQRMICSVTYLIREAAYIPDHSTQILGSMSLNICPLSVLLDMHHAQKATKRHDKVYALLSMSSDDLRGTSLSPNYTISWEDLFRRLLKHLIPGATSVQTCQNREVAIIKSKGRIIGKVVSVQKDSARGDRLCLETAHEETPWNFEGAEDWSNRWSIQMSAKTIQNGDFICVFEGASKPTIVRLHRDYFTVVVLEVLFPDETPAWSRAVKEKISSLSELYPSRDLLLVWDWENSLEDLADPPYYEDWIRTNEWELEEIKTGPKGDLTRATRMWNVVLVFHDLLGPRPSFTYYEEIEERGREVIRTCEMAMEAKLAPSTESEYDRSLLSLSTQDTHGAVVDLLYIAIDEAPDRHYGISSKMLLAWATQGCHKAVAELLLRTGNIDMDILGAFEFEKWPLYIAVFDGHETMVELLLKLSKLNTGTMNLAAPTLLSLAAERENKNVLRTLLEAWPDFICSESYSGPKPLFLAASIGSEDMVKLLLKTAKVEVDGKYAHGQTPLSKAAAGGHEEVVKLLLDTRKVDPDLKDNNGQTPLLFAATNGHVTVVRLLLVIGQAEVNSANQYGETPLSRAVLGRHESVVRILLSTRKVDFTAKDSFSLQTPLSLAAERGYEAIVKLLLEEGDFDVTLKDGFSLQSPISRAAKGGHKAVMKLLLKADFQRKKERALPPRPSLFLPVSRLSSKIPRLEGLAELLKLSKT